MCGQPEPIFLGALEGRGAQTRGKLRKSGYWGLGWGTEMCRAHVTIARQERILSVLINLAELEAAMSLDSFASIRAARLFHFV
jgi:hypothetical protein